MQFLRDILSWLGVDTNALHNWQLLIGAFMGLLVLAAIVVGGLLCIYAAQRLIAEEKQKSHRAKMKADEEATRANKKDAESRIQRAKLSADAAEAERLAQERMDGPKREVEKFKGEIARLKEELSGKVAQDVERAKAIETLQQEKKNLKDKLDMEIQNRRSLELQLDDMKTQLNEAVEEADTYRNKAAEAIADAPVQPMRPASGSAARRPASGAAAAAVRPASGDRAASGGRPLVTPKPASGARPASGPRPLADQAPETAEVEEVPPPSVPPAISPRQSPSTRPRRSNDSLDEVDGPPGSSLHSANEEPSGEGFVVDRDPKDPGRNAF